MPIDKTDADAFFVRYAAALSTHDAEAIAQYWAVPAIVLGNEGAIPVARMDEIAAFFAGSLDEYSEVAKAEAVLKSALVLSSATIACEIEWRHLDETGEQIGEETGHYILRDGGTGLRIQVYTPKL